MFRGGPHRAKTIRLSSAGCSGRGNRRSAPGWAPGLGLYRHASAPIGRAERAAGDIEHLVEAASVVTTRTLGFRCILILAVRRSGDASPPPLSRLEDNA